MRLFVNPFAIWTGLAFKIGEAMMASVHAVSARANAPRVAVIAANDAPPGEAGPASVKGAIVIGISGRAQARLADRTLELRPFSQLVVLPGMACQLTGAPTCSMELISLLSIPPVVPDTG